MLSLTADETRLLLAAKGHPIKGVRSKHRVGSYEYIQDVCNARCGVEKNASVFLPYNVLASKLLTSNAYSIILSNLHRRFENPFIESPEITARVLTETLLIAVSNLRVENFLMLDLSLIRE